jgi:hypothetical protein
MMQGAEATGAIADNGLVRVRPIGVCATCYAIVGITEDRMFLVDVDGCQCTPDVWDFSDMGQHIVLCETTTTTTTTTGRREGMGTRTGTRVGAVGDAGWAGLRM